MMQTKEGGIVTTEERQANNRRIAELPLNGRNALSLMYLSPDVKAQAGTSGFGDRGTALSNVSINGGDASNNATANVSVAGTVTTSPSTINITNVLGFNGNRACVTTTAASTVAQYNPTFSAANVIVSGGTVTAIAINGTATGLTSGSFSLGSQDRLTETYSVQPTTTWCGQ